MINYQVGADSIGFQAITSARCPCRARQKARGDLTVRHEITPLILALCLSGCAPAALVPAQVASGLVESVGSTAGTLWTSPSVQQLNGANTGLAQAEARAAIYKAAESQANDRRAARERVVTARLLRQMAQTYHDSLLKTLAEWVEGGGDPDFAFKYALVQVNPSSTQIRVIPPQTGLTIEHNRLASPNHIAPSAQTHQPQLRS